jgi:hypothetical protein
MGFKADRARVLEPALTLPVEDRAKVTHQLPRSLESADGDGEVVAAWNDEIRRRIDEIDAGTAEAARTG